MYNRKPIDHRHDQLEREAREDRGRLFLLHERSNKDSTMQLHTHATGCRRQRDIALHNSQRSSGYCTLKKKTRNEKVESFKILCVEK